MQQFVDFVQVVAVIILGVAIYASCIWFTIKYGRYLRRSSTDTNTLDDFQELSWPDLAYLDGKELRVFQSATVWLVQHQILQYHPEYRTLEIRQPLPENAFDVCQEVYRRVQEAGNQINVDTVRGKTGHRRERMAMLGLCYSALQKKRITFFAVSQLLIAILLMPLPYYLHPLTPKNKLCEAVFIISTFPAGVGVSWFSMFQFFYLLSKNHRTLYGDLSLIEQQRILWPDRPKQSFRIGDVLPPAHLLANLALGVAAFGELIIRNTEFKDLIPGLSDPSSE